MEIVVDAKVTAGPEGVAATEKEPDTGGGGGRKLTSRWIEKRLGQPLRRVSQTETTLALLLRPFLAPLFPLFSASCNTPRILPLPTLSPPSPRLSHSYSRFLLFRVPRVNDVHRLYARFGIRFTAIGRRNGRGFVSSFIYIYICMCMYIYI